MFFCNVMYLKHNQCFKKKYAVPSSPGLFSFSLFEILQGEKKKRQNLNAVKRSVTKPIEMLFGKKKGDKKSCC